MLSAQHYPFKALIGYTHHFMLLTILDSQTCMRHDPVITLDIFETCMTSIRWQKWFTDQAFTIYMARYMVIYTTARGLLVLANTWHRKDNDGIISAFEPNVFSFCYQYITFCVQI